MTPLPTVSRRALLKGGCLIAAAAAAPAWAQRHSMGMTSVSRGMAGVLSGPRIALNIRSGHFATGGRSAHAVTVNGSLPAPLIRLKEGQTVRIEVSNHSEEPSSIHWHGLLVPFQMDGVPGVSFPGIGPGETFTYEFPIIQSGTYWYHSHSGLQEQEGHYGPIIIDPKGVDPVAYDREHVVVLSDYSFTHPHLIFKRLKQQPGFFNHRKQTVAGLLAGQDQSLAERVEWAAMRMD